MFIRVFFSYFFSIQQPGLTEQTSRALHQTCEAIMQMSKYLLENCGFNYVLLGKIQSDMIEQLDPSTEWNKLLYFYKTTSRK